MAIIKRGLTLTFQGTYPLGQVKLYSTCPSTKVALKIAILQEFT